MTDKELIKQEIERMKEHTAKCGYPGQGEFENGNREGRNYVCDKLLSFIDSLPEEPESDDLEEYYKKEFLPKEWFAKSGQRTVSEFNFFTAKHFAEWQKQAMKETLQTEYEKGRFAMKEEMIEGAIDCSIILHPNDRFANYSISAYVPPLHPASTYISNGDKVKIIIVKTEQQ